MINNKTSINGALASALVERSNLLEDKSHEYTGDGDARKCSVTVKRKGRSKPATWSFSLKEAKTAGLYPANKEAAGAITPTACCTGVRSASVSAGSFRDVLQGMYLTEELVDETPEVKIVTEAPPEPKAASWPKPFKKEEPPPFTPDPEDPKSHEHPIIAAPSDIRRMPRKYPWKRSRPKTAISLISGS